MARKKNRSLSVLPPQPVAAGALTATPASTGSAPTPAPRSDTGQGTFLETAAGQALVKLFKAFASLQLAVVLLALFAAAMVLGTLIESWYSADIAGHTVYGAWWFVLLLLLLATNIACAALKKMDTSRISTTPAAALYLTAGFLLLPASLWCKLVVMPRQMWREFMERVRLAPGLAALVLVFLGGPGLIALPLLLLLFLPFLLVGLLVAPLLTRLHGLQGVVEAVDSLFAKGWDLWPWKRHQTGFLVTHIGLLTLLFGGFLSALYGTDGQMVMIDTADRKLQEQIGLSNQTNTIHLYNKHQLDIFRLPNSDSPKAAELMRVIRRGEDVPPDLKDQLKGQWTTQFSPGPFSWYDDPEKDYQVDLPLRLTLLNALASPAPGHTANLDSGLGVRVTNFFSHAEAWPYAAAGKDDRSPFAAILLRLSSPNFGNEGVNRWLVDRIESVEGHARLIDFLLLTAPDSVVVPEFTNPPSPAEMGKDGQLALYLEGQQKPVRINIDREQVGKPVRLEGTDLLLTVLSVNNLAEEVARMQKIEVAPGDLALYPALQFRVSGEEGSAEYMISARGPSMRAVSTDEQKGRESRAPARFSAWYHYPDFRWGAPEADVKGAIQMLLLPNDRLFARVFGSDGLRDQGFEVDPNDTRAVYDLPFREPMKMSFRIGGFLPRATVKRNFMPRNLRAGTETSATYQPAIRGQLQVGRETRDFWARMDTAPTAVEAGGDLFLIRYRPARVQTDFTVTLTKATGLKDPGSDRAASFQSDIVLKDPGQTDGRKESVYMNHIVDHGGYRLFQANFEPMRFESMRPIKDGDRPVNKSGLSVRRDPGRTLIYVGFSVAALGIVIMFWMKAYFFKPVGRRNVEEQAVINEVVIQ